MFEITTEDGRKVPYTLLHFSGGVYTANPFPQVDLNNKILTVI
jgi:hypothetical protein